METRDIDARPSATLNYTDEVDFASLSDASPTKARLSSTSARSSSWHSTKPTATGPSNRLRSYLRSTWREVVRDRKVYLMASCASFGGMLFGWDTGLIGGVLSMASFQRSFNLNAKDSKAFARTTGDIVSSLQAGCFFGALMITPLCSTRYGRKKAIILAALVFLLGSVLQTLAGIRGSSSLAPLYAGRAIGGWGVGAISAVVPAYISESSPRSIRGRTTGMMQLFNVTGIAIAFWINYGNNLHFDKYNPSMWRLSFGLQIIPGMILLIGMLFQHESPRWLCERGRTAEARHVLASLNRRSQDDPYVSQQLDDILDSFKGRTRLSLLGQLRAMGESRTILYRSLAGVFFMWAQQWTGTNALNYYSPRVFQSLGIVGTTNSLFATGLYGIVKVIFTLLVLLIAIEQAGRKPCLIFGGLGQAACMFYIGIYIRLSHSSESSDATPPTHLTAGAYVAVVAIFLYVVFYSMGYGPIPWVLSAEIAPNHTRQCALSLAVMTQWAMNYTIAKITPIMLDTINYGAFLLFAGCCVFITLIVIFFLPETRGLRLEAMASAFEGNLVRRSLQDTPIIRRCISRKA
ncbi:uncharacterized protein L969DRAFT_89643 [Mixia osmundae IAM 14324]|uniref:Major facilitator superfamily (MFS) profile domain-containing protein n=1 Tax=Mixia osmundae (strain CBS 9802 / IAM 14324 / JCM 22182 / KY 12970) TaxID=764103 RepID=G7E4Q1_MIXOS|nr:uncharacterized protein L969DRAFT_89643 [Mixia osmundae IAM 14324]KEI37671.1 hypothetical protein L969DRAFT_89643 [Mixia osmundae IAM 14324]GAA97811.1 hypothetical protein E5Q_04490 [Mixia osmundae IAM 14324]